MIKQLYFSFLLSLALILFLNMEDRKHIKRRRTSVMNAQVPITSFSCPAQDRSGSSAPSLDSPFPKANILASGSPTSFY